MKMGVRAVTRIPESGSPRTSRRWPWQGDSSLKLGSGGHYLSKSYPKYSKVQEKEQVFLNQSKFNVSSIKIQEQERDYQLTVLGPCFSGQGDTI